MSKAISTTATPPPLPRSVTSKETLTIDVKPELGTITPKTKELFTSTPSLSSNPNNHFLVAFLRRRMVLSPVTPMPALVLGGTGSASAFSRFLLDDGESTGMSYAAFVESVVSLVKSELQLHLTI